MLHHENVCRGTSHQYVSVTPHHTLSYLILIIVPCRVQRTAGRHTAEALRRRPKLPESVVFLARYELLVSALDWRLHGIQDISRVLDQLSDVEHDEEKERQREEAEAKREDQRQWELARKRQEDEDEEEEAKERERRRQSRENEKRKETQRKHAEKVEKEKRKRKLGTLAISPGDAKAAKTAKAKSAADAAERESSQFLESQEELNLVEKEAHKDKVY